MNTLQLMEYMSKSKINNALAEKAALEAQASNIDAYISKRRKLISAMLDFGFDNDSEEIKAIQQETIDYLKRC